MTYQLNTLNYILIINICKLNQLSVHVFHIIKFMLCFVELYIRHLMRYLVYQVTF